MQKDCSVSENGIFARSRDLLGDEGLKRLRSSFVVIIGQGGVGSHAAIACARSGVGRLRLVDVDLITESSLNRHAVATAADVGRSKSEVMAKYIAAVCPETKVEISSEFFHENTAASLLSGSPDYVIDAIDSLTPKVALLRYCVENEIPVVASMGASGRTDPSKLEIADIKDTRMCPLARVVRRRLKRQNVFGGIDCVYSTEEASVTFPPEEDDDNHFWQGRKRNRLPSLAIMPGIFGYACAGQVIEKISCYSREKRIEEIAAGKD